jgi:hypothetical protein
MNPMLKGLRPQNMMNVMNRVNQLQNNPQGIYDLLKNSGRLSNEQLSAIQKMNNPAEIGQYLLNTAPQNMYGQIQNGVNQYMK